MNGQHQIYPTLKSNLSIAKLNKKKKKKKNLFARLLQSRCSSEERVYCNYCYFHLDLKVLRVITTNFIKAFVVIFAMTGKRRRLQKDYKNWSNFYYKILNLNLKRCNKNCTVAILMLTTEIKLNGLMQVCYGKDICACEAK